MTVAPTDAALINGHGRDRLAFADGFFVAPTDAALINGHMAASWAGTTVTSRANRRSLDQWTRMYFIDRWPETYVAPTDAALINGHLSVMDDIKRELASRQPTQP